MELITILSISFFCMFISVDTFKNNKRNIRNIRNIKNIRNIRNKK